MQPRATADLFDQYDLKRRNADEYRNAAEGRQDLEVFRKWILVEMDAQTSLYSLAEVVQLLSVERGQFAARQEVSQPGKRLSSLRIWMTGYLPASTDL